MTKSSVALIVDVGGQSIRGVLLTPELNVLEKISYPCTTLSKPNGFIEHQPAELRQTFSQVIKKSMDRARGLACQVTALGLTVQRSSFVCVDRITGLALSPVLSWQDTRAAADLAHAKIDRTMIWQHSGLICNAHYGASKMLWCQNHYPWVGRAKTQSRLVFLPLAGYLTLQLSELKRFVIDPSIAARTLLFNIDSLAWDDLLMNAFDIDRHCLPEVLSHDQVIPLRTRFGTMEKTWVMGDQNAAFFARPHALQSASRVMLNLGTGGFLVRPMAAHRTQLATRPGLLTTLLIAAPKPRYALEATINGVASALAWFQDQYQLDSIKPYHPLAALECDNLFFNSIGGLGAPFWQAQIKPRFNRAADVDAMLKAVYESILFLVKLNFDLMNHDACVEGIDLSGGMAQDQAFNQAIADLCQVPLVYNTQYEATAVGAARLLFNQFDQVGRKDSLEFLPNNNTQLLQRYHQWREFVDMILNE